MGAIASIVTLFGVGFIVLGSRTNLKLAVLLLVVGSFMIAFLYWQGSINFLGFPYWTGIIIGLIGLTIATVIFVTWDRFHKIYLVSGLAMVVIVSGFVVISGFGDTDNVGESNSMTPQSQSVMVRVGERLASIGSEVTSGGLSGRYNHWLVSLDIILNRPWTSLDEPTFGWSRPWFGYGPDLFRYVYLFKSPPSPPLYLPHEPDHAHNFLIHQTLEQGLLGLLSTVVLFGAILWVAIQVIIRSLNMKSTIDGLLMMGLLATLVGKCVEMTVGVARISDLTIFWVLLAGLASLLILQNKNNIKDKNRQSSSSLIPPNRGSGRRRGPKRYRSNSRLIRFSILALLSPLIICVGFMGWKNNIDYLNAGRLASDSVQEYYRGNLQDSLTLLDQALLLVGDVPIYHNIKASVYSDFLTRIDGPKEISCSDKPDIHYQSCIAKASLNNNLNALTQRPLNFRSRLVLAEFFNDYGDHENSVLHYSQALELVPHSWIIREELARQYLKLGEASRSIELINESLDLREGSFGSKSLFLKGKGYVQLAELELAAQSFEASLVQGLGLTLSNEAYEILQMIYPALSLSRGVTGYKEIINGTSLTNTRARHDYGRFLHEMGDHQSALDVFDELLTMRDDSPTEYLYFDHRLHAEPVEASRAFVFRDITFENKAVEEIDHSTVLALSSYYQKSLVSSPSDAYTWLALGELQAEIGNYDVAKNALRMAIKRGIPYERETSRNEIIGKAFNVLMSISQGLDSTGSLPGDDKANPYRPYNDMLFKSLNDVGEPVLAAEYLEVNLLTSLLLGDHDSVLNVLAEAYRSLENSRMIPRAKTESLETGHQVKVAEAYYDAGHIELAANYLEKVLIHNPPTLDEVNDNFAFLEQMYDELSVSRAIQGYDNIIANQLTPMMYDLVTPGQPQRSVVPSYKKAEFLNKIGRHKEALDIFESLLEASYDHPAKEMPILLNKAHTLSHMGLYKLAITDYEEVLDYIYWYEDSNAKLHRIEKPYYPGLEDIWLALARCQFQLGYHVALLEVVDMLANLESEQKSRVLNERISRLREREISETYLIADRYHQLGESQLAAEFLEQRIAKGHSGWIIDQSLTLLVKIYAGLDVSRIIDGYKTISPYVSDDENLSGYLQKAESSQLAAEYLETVLVSKLSDLEIAEYLGELGEPLIAATYVEKALINGVSDYDEDRAFNILSEVYKSLERSRVISGVKKIKPENGYDVKISEVYYEAGHIELAANYLEKVLIHNPPTLDEVNDNFAFLEQMYDELSVSRAIQGYDNIIANQLTPMMYDLVTPGQPQRSVVPSYKKAEFLNKIGRHKEALDIFESLLEASYDHPAKEMPILLNKAHTLSHMGLYKLAITDYEEVLDYIYWYEDSNGKIRRIEKPYYPGLEDIWLALADAYTHTSNYDLAEEAIIVASKIE